MVSFRHIGLTEVPMATVVDSGVATGALHAPQPANPSSAIKAAGASASQTVMVVGSGFLVAFHWQTIASRY